MLALLACYIHRVHREEEHREFIERRNTEIHRENIEKGQRYLGIDTTNTEYRIPITDYRLLTDYNQ
jgi:hypothetical protein